MAQEGILVSAFYVLVFTTMLVTYRVLRGGPTLPDRIVGLNTITTKVVVVIAVVSVIRG